MAGESTAAASVLRRRPFIVNGAAPPPNAALTTLGAEPQLANGWTAAAKFDRKPAGRSQTYAGAGTLRYAW